jgi:hypothetical protein
MLTALAAAAVLAGSAPAERSIAPLSGPTDVKAYNGVAVFSLPDGDKYRLAMSRNGGPPRALPVPAQDRRFDADIGPDASGRPTVVLTSCDATGCGLSTLALDGSAPVKTGIAVRRRGVHPTLWRGTIAWLASAKRVRIGTSTISVDADIEEIELNGRHLGMTVIADPPGGGGVCGQREVRLLDVRTRRSRTLGSHLCGLNGQTWVGPSFDARRLYFTRTCNEDGICGSSRYGVYRYDLRTGRYALAGDSRSVVSWAYGGRGSAYRVRGGGWECLDDCALYRVTGLRFKAARAPR